MAKKLGWSGDGRERKGERWRFVLTTTASPVPRRVVFWLGLSYKSMTCD